MFPTWGNTGIFGLPVLISTTQVGQIEGVWVCADYCTFTDFFVAYTPRIPLLSGNDWVRIGATTSHPVNHFGTVATVLGIMAVASQYHSDYPAYDVIAINDIGLVMGGIFDLNKNWAGPHFNHSRGKAVDIRGNGLPNSVQRIPSVQERFMEICEDYGASLVLHESQGTSNEHFHCEWP